MKKTHNNQFLIQCMEYSKDYLDFLYLELKIYKKQLNDLNDKKPLWFQKKKLKKYEEEKVILENKIRKKHQNIIKELEAIQKMIEN